MNIFEMHIGVNLGVQKIASHINGDLLPQEIDYYLNNAITDFVREQYSFLKTPTKDVQSQYVNENLQTLLKSVAVTDFINENKYGNAVTIDFPNDYLYYIYSTSRYNVPPPATDSFTKTHRRVEAKGLSNYIQTATNRPQFRELPVLIENNKLVIIGDQNINFGDFVRCNLTYLRKPARVKAIFAGNVWDEASVDNINCDLPDFTHKQIVDLTVQTILKDLNQFKSE